jgi:hypothetical protein
MAATERVEYLPVIGAAIGSSRRYTLTVLAINPIPITETMGLN